MATKLANVVALMGLIKEARWYGCGLSGPDGTEWADQFKGSPLYQDALAIQKDDAQQDVQRAQRRAAQDMEMAQESMFRVRQSELEAHLAAWKYAQMGMAGGDAPMGGREPAVEIGGPAEVPPGAVEEVAIPEPPVEAAPAPAAAMGVAPNAMPPKAASLRKLAGEKVAITPGTGYGVAVSPEGRRFQGGIRGLLGETGGGVLGGVTGGVTGGAVGAGVGHLVGGQPGALLGANIGSVVGGLPGAIYGQHKGMRMATHSLAEETGLTPEEESNIATRAMVGGTAGSILTAPLGVAPIGAYVGGVAGASSHPKLQARDRKEKARHAKEASLIECAHLWRAIESGELGKEASAAYEGILAAYPIEEATKVASVEHSSQNGGETDDRKRRLDELLRKRQPTGLDTGSASPQPPRDGSC